MMKYFATGCAMVAVGLFAYVVNASNLISYISSDPKVCINCHPMNAHYATWQHSSHREKATCVQCHLPQDSFVGKMSAKARDGFIHSVAMTFHSFEHNIRASDSTLDRIQSNCISCHREIVSQMAINSALYNKDGNKGLIDSRCWSCHRDVPHGVNSSMAATPDNLGVKEI